MARYMLDTNIVIARPSSTATFETGRPPKGKRGFAFVSTARCCDGCADAGAGDAVKALAQMPRLLRERKDRGLGAA